MIVIDANLLIYSYDRISPLHTASKRWLGETFSYEEEVGLPFQSILAFNRVSTNQSLPGTRSAMAVSLATVDSWLELANVTVLTPGPKHWRIFKELCIAAGVTGTWQPTLTSRPSPSKVTPPFAQWTGTSRVFRG